MLRTNAPRPDKRKRFFCQKKNGEICPDRLRTGRPQEWSRLTALVLELDHRDSVARGCQQTHIRKRNIFNTARDFAANRDTVSCDTPEKIALLFRGFPMCVPSLSWQNDDLYIENVDQKPVSRNARHVVDVDVSRRALAHVDVRHGPIHLIAHTMYKQTPRRFCQDRLRPSVLSRQAQTVGLSLS